MVLAGQCEDCAVMNEAIDDGSCGHLIGKDLCPFLEGPIRCQRDAASLVALRDELKEQIGRFPLCLYFVRGTPL